MRRAGYRSCVPYGLLVVFLAIGAMLPVFPALAANEAAVSMDWWNI